MSAIDSPSSELSNETVSSAAPSRSNDESRPIESQCRPSGALRTARLPSRASSSR